MRKVQEESFWKERIDDAKEIGQLHYSVYNANKHIWDNIVYTHEAIINKEVSGKVLDAGCGYGRLSETIDDYVGVDFSKDFIDLAMEKYPDKHFHQASLKKLPFEDNSFDWAICVSIKGMIIANEGGDEWDEMEKELKRVAKKILILEYSSPGEYEII